MSHNKLKIGSQEATRTGQYNVNLEHLSNVDATATNDTILKFDGSSWVNADLFSEDFDSDGIAAGWSTFNASGGGAYVVNGTGVDSYRTHTAINWSSRTSDQYFETGNITINRTTHGGTTPSQVRFSRIELNANGKYLLVANTKVYNTSSSTYIEWQWLDTSTDAALSARWRQYGGNVGDTGYCIGYAEVTSGSRVCDIRCMARTGGSDGATSKVDILGAIQIG